MCWEKKKKKRKEKNKSRNWNTGNWKVDSAAVADEVRLLCSCTRQRFPLLCMQSDTPLPGDSVWHNTYHVLSSQWGDAHFCLYGFLWPLQRVAPQLFHCPGLGSGGLISLQVYCRHNLNWTLTVRVRRLPLNQWTQFWSCGLYTWLAVREYTHWLDLLPWLYCLTPPEKISAHKV